MTTNTLVTRADLLDIPTPAPTPTWTPIPHIALVRQVMEAMTDTGMRVVDERHEISHSGLRYFGKFRIWSDTDYALQVGLRNSHDKLYPASLIAGSYVFVCSNGAFSGEVRMVRRHTRHILSDLPHLVSRAVAKLGDLRRTQAERIDTYKNVILNDKDMNDLLVRAVDRRVMPVTKLPKVLAEWREPSFEDFRPRTAWSAFNAFTTVLRDSSSDMLPRRTMALHGLMDQATGLALMPAKTNTN